MIPERIAAVLACPRCKSRPSIGKTVLCSICGCEYPIEGNVPIMHTQKDRREIEKEIINAKIKSKFNEFFRGNTWRTRE